MMNLKDHFIDSMLLELDRTPDEIEEEYVAQLTALADMGVSDDGE